MKTMMMTLVMILTCQKVLASDIYLYDTEVTKLNIINKQLSLAPIVNNNKNHELEKALKQQWDLVVSAIPINSAPIQNRKFKFAKNLPTVQRSLPVQSRSTQIQSITTTKILYGSIQQQFIVDGSDLVIVDKSVHNQSK